MRDEYIVKYVSNDDGVWAYLQEYPNTIKYGSTKKEAFVNLMLLLHGDKNEDCS